eukprot:Em0006g936a
MGDRSRWSDPKFNPCLEEAKASYKCMDDNNYDRDACLEYFKSYKECKKRMVCSKTYVRCICVTGCGYIERGLGKQAIYQVVPPSVYDMRCNAGVAQFLFEESFAVFKEFFRCSFDFRGDCLRCSSSNISIQA